MTNTTAQYNIIVADQQVARGATMFDFADDKGRQLGAMFFIRRVTVVSPETEHGLRWAFTSNHPVGTWYIVEVQQTRNGKRYGATPTRGLGTFGTLAAAEAHAAAVVAKREATYRAKFAR